MIYYPDEDSYLLTEQVKKFSKGKKVLDVGSGTGIQAITAKKASAVSIFASDISEESIKLLRSKNIPAIKSALFQNIKGRFDLIIFNPPYLPEDKREPKQSQITTTGGKKGDEIILKFLKQAKPHLEKNGIILIVLSSLTPKDRINIILKKLNFKKTILSAKNLFMETLEVWEIQ